MKYRLSKRNGIIVLVGILVIMFVGVIILVTNGNNSKEEDHFEDYSVVGGILNTRDIGDAEIGVKNSSLGVASRYDIKNSNVKESKKDMYFGDLKGKVLFVRGKNNNMNVFQGIYNIEKKDEDDQPSLMKVNDYINNYKSAFYSFANISSDTKPVEEKLYGESKYWFKIPVEESVYVEKRLYSLSYKVNIDDVDDGDKELVYELNFYMKGKELVCELVRIF